MTTTQDSNDNHSPSLTDKSVKNLIEEEEKAQDEPVKKSTWQKLFPVMACGAGLFSDGYINNVIGSVSTILARQHGTLYTNSDTRKNVSALAFAGTVLGQLIFGYTSDKWSRMGSIMASTSILIVFTALSAGALAGKETCNKLSSLSLPIDFSLVSVLVVSILLEVWLHLKLLVI
jgi:MFS family permease